MSWCPVTPWSDVLVHHHCFYCHLLYASAGLMTLAAAKSFGATSLAITDISPQNIALAKKMGATEAYCHPRTATPQEIADHLKKMLSPFGPEIIIDCVGFESTVQTAIRSCCMGGKVVVVGMGQDNMTLPMSTVGVHELDVLGCFRYANTVSLASCHILAASLGRWLFPQRLCLSWCCMTPSVFVSHCWCSADMVLPPQTCRSCSQLTALAAC